MTLTEIIASEVRARRSVSARALADQAAALSGLPITRDTIANLENGRRRGLTIDEADAIARALGHTLADLLQPSAPCPTCRGTGRVQPQ